MKRRNLHDALLLKRGDFLRLGRLSLSGAWRAVRDEWVVMATRDARPRAKDLRVPRTEGLDGSTHTGTPSMSVFPSRQSWVRSRGLGTTETLSVRPLPRRKGRGGVHVHRNTGRSRSSVPLTAVSEDRAGKFNTSHVTPSVPEGLREGLNRCSKTKQMFPYESKPKINK